MKKYFTIVFFFNLTLLLGQEYYVEDFGGQSKSMIDNTPAIQDAVDQCANQGGGIVVLSQGTYLSGTIVLKNNVSLKISPNSRLKAIEDTTAFKAMEPPTKANIHRKALIYAKSVKNIRVFGGGEIDVSGGAECFSKLTNPNRPNGLLIINCSNVIVEDLYMHSSVSWMQRYHNCQGVRISNLRIYNHSNKNNDGLDIDSSRDVIVSDCIIDSTDDAIVIKSYGENPARNITISNCIVASHASAVKLGTESVGGFENISISNIIIRRSVSKKMIHPLKAWDGLTGIEILTTDGGILRHVLVSDIIMEGVENPIHVRLGNRLRRAYPFTASEDIEESKFEFILEDVNITNVLCKNTGPYPIIIAGFEGHPVKRVTLRDVTVICGKPGTENDLNVAPNWEADGYPGRGMYNTNLPAHGLVSYYTKDLKIENFRVIPADGEVRPCEQHYFRE